MKQPARIRRLADFGAAKAGAYTRPLRSST